MDEEVEELERLAEQAGAHKSSMSLATLQRLHPAGLAPDWADKLHDKMYVSEHAQSTHEHYMQVRGAEVSGCVYFVGCRHAVTAGMCRLCVGGWSAVGVLCA